MVKQATEKALTIIVPAYNVGQYLDRCLKSIELNLKEIEVIIVNDGSTDETLSVAKKWGKQYPKDITVISQENGGHGSTINVGIKKATGKYVRVLDSDDWLNEKTVDKYIETLKREESDIVLTDYSRSIAKDEGEKVVHYSFKQFLSQKKYPISNYSILSANLDLIELFSIHTISVKTETIKKAWGGGLLEKTLYEDQEWVAKVILAAESFTYRSIDVYQYFIGRNEQSMNKDKMFKNRKHHERVVKRLVELANDADEIKKDILIRRIATIMRTHYWIYYYHPKITKAERQEYKKMKTYLKKNLPAALKSIDLKYKLRLFVGRKRQELHN